METIIFTLVTVGFVLGLFNLILSLSNKKERTVDLKENWNSFELPTVKNKKERKKSVSSKGAFLIKTKSKAQKKFESFSKRLPDIANMTVEEIKK